MKIPTIRKLPSGNYFCQLRIDGKSISITERTEAMCRAKAMAYKTGVIEKKKAPRSVTLREAIDDYIVDRENVLSPATIRGYRSIQNARFSSVMDKPLKNVTNWQRVINSEAKIVSAKTLKNAWALVCSVLKEEYIDIPRVNLPQIVKNERPFLDPDQIKIFMKAIEGADCEIPALLALHSLRRSEILGLKKSDVTNGQIRVHGAAVFNERGELIHKETNKTVSSDRIVPIMIPRLSVLIDTLPEGNIITCYPNTIRRRINKICENNDLPLVGTHGLRHSFASLAYHLGLSEKETMRLGGWSDSNTMRNIYTHLAEKDKINAENRLKEFFSE